LKRTHRRLARGLCLFATLLAATALGQGTSVISGTVLSAETKRPIPDVVVTALSPALQGERTVVTDGTGLYRIPQLPSGVYTLRVDGPGFRPYERGDVTLRLDTTIRVNVELLPESLTEDVTVTAAAPVVDVGSAAGSVTIDRELLRTVPLIRPGSKGSASRSFEGLAELAPGANADQYGVGVNGSSSPESQFVVDGLSVNDPAVGTLGSPLSVEFVKEVNVIASGYMPEYGRSTGGVLNVVTKSGSNEFHGSVFSNVAPGFLQTAPTAINASGTTISAQGRPWMLGDLGFDLGGPLIKDKLWFYVGAAPSANRIQVERQLNAQDICSEVNPDEGCLAVGGQRRIAGTNFLVTRPIPGTQSYRFADERSVQYMGKLTYNFDEDHNVSVSLMGLPRRSGSEGGYSFSRDGAPEVCTGLTCSAFVQGSYDSIATRRQNDALGLVAKHSSSFLNRTLLVDTTLGFHRQDNAILPSDGTGVDSGEGLSATSRFNWRRTGRTINDFEPLPDPSVCVGPTGGNICPISSYSTGGPGTISNEQLQRLQAKALATYTFQGAGHHILKAGFDAEGMSYSNRRARTGRTPWQENANGTWFSQTEYGYLAAPDVPVFDPVKEGTSRSMTVGGFLQDQWSVLDVVTLNVGVRYDQQTIWGLDNRVGLHLPNQWSPRLGVIYDPTQQGRAKVYANFARFFENVPLDMADLSFPQQRLLRTTYSATCRPYDPASRASDCVASNRVVGGNAATPNQVWNAEGGDPVPVDPNIKAQSIDEYTVGGEYELFLGRLGLNYTHRRVNDVIEDMSRDDGNTFFLGNPGQGYSADFPRAFRRYNGINLYYEKNFGNQWLARASYTYSRLDGNYSGLFRADTGQLSPNLTRDFDLLSLTTNRFGLLPGDRPHSVKVYGAREFDLGGTSGLSIGAGYRGMSGTPLNYLGGHPQRSGAETFILPRASGGRTPWLHNFDGRLAFNQKVGGYDMTFTLDVFNILDLRQVTQVDQTLVNTNVRVNAVTDGSVTPAQLEECANMGRNHDASTGAGPTCSAVTRVTTDPATNNTPVTASEMNRNFGQPVAFQDPRSIRIGLKVGF
jgi:hypothetical protein